MEDALRQPTGRLADRNIPAREHASQILSQLNDAAWKTARWHTEQRFSASGLSAIAVLLLRRERADEQRVRQEVRVEQGGVHPREQRGIFGRVTGVIGKVPFRTR